ncbi:TolC family protein [Sulfurovum sp. XGS-02]|uniref:TolC family protein n=1 Tax=Sulfurovum sp. XGS-02 TaxID=2925411 RepID=UPI00205C64F6|nr:TolC family protein [Sulfurovum sp. XGS-02]UPT78349.1 TolC family protein [Sulfurovum sp. XGS-02]
MKKTLLGYCIYLCIFSHDALSKEIFTVEHMKQYLTKENPYIYTAVGQQYIDEARIRSAEGDFDTRLSVAYDQKEYPISTGEFSDISLNKPTENGTEFIVGYRKAEGIQEYNNIKTGNEGELRLGVKVPVFSLLNNMNERKYTLDSAKINATRSAFESQNNLRNLYTHIVTSYYQLLYYSEVLKLEKRLLHKATKRDRFIEKRVRSGDLADVALLESKQQIINREQRVLRTKNSYIQALQTFLKYMNLSKKEFDGKYALPSLKILKKEKIIFHNVISQALKRRPDLKALESQRTKLDLDTAYNSVSAYPKLNLFAYGVHDIQYGEGIKVGLQFDIPLERRSYKGKRVEIQKGMSQIEEEKNRLLLELKTNLSNLMYALDIVNQNIELGEKETKIVESLEEAENKKYEVGSSDLFQINQREIRTLEVKKKQLEYHLNALVIQQEIKKEMGEGMTL